MFENKSIGVVVPAYNEEKLLGGVIESMPDFVDAIIVVEDGSTDRTLEVIEPLGEREGRVHLIRHETNEGLGQSLIDGYLKAIDLGMDITAVMAGDAQMSPDDLNKVISPVVSGEYDYVKGNRLLRDDVIDRMPRYRLFGNAVLSLLTKFATGYWQLIDPQCGYTAISKDALARIPIRNMTKGYGYNADILNMLNLSNFRVCDVEVEPVYGEEKSGIRLGLYICSVSVLLVRLFIRRLTHKYLIRDFHPLVLFYAFSFFNLLVIVPPVAVRFVIKYIELGFMPPTTLLILFFSFSIAFLSLFFGMWLDMEDNRRLASGSR